LSSAIWRGQLDWLADHGRRAIAYDRRGHGRSNKPENGYEYDSDTYDDELPYWLNVGKRRQLIVPYSVVHNDVRFARQGMTSGDDYETYIKNAVTCVLEEDPPRMLSFGLHNRIIAHPGRALGLARVLDWLTNQPKVWVTRRIDIARHWRKVHPA